MDELDMTAAAFFRSKGKNVVTENEFFMGVSMDLRWLQPAETKELISLLINSGVLEKDGEYLRPSFDIRSADVPIGFRPSSDVLRIKRKKIVPPAADDPLSVLAAEAGTLGMEKRDFIISLNAIQKQMNIDIEVAALLLFREKGADIADRCDDAYRAIAGR